MATDYLVLEEDGTSKFTLEDASGAILLEESTGGGGAVDDNTIKHHHFHAH